MTAHPGIKAKLDRKPHRGLTILESSDATILVPNLLASRLLNQTPATFSPRRFAAQQTFCLSRRKLFGIEVSFITSRWLARSCSYPLLSKSHDQCQRSDPGIETQLFRMGQSEFAAARFLLASRLRSIFHQSQSYPRACRLHPSSSRSSSGCHVSRRVSTAL